MAANSNDPLWFSRYEAYPHDQEIAKPEGREASGFKVEVPLEVIEALYTGEEPRPDRDQDKFYQEYAWYQVPLEIHSQAGWRTNPAALAPPQVDDNEEESDRQREVYHGTPVSHLSIQTTAGQPFVEFHTSKRGVAGIYYCVRQREKNPEGYRVTDKRNYMPVARITVVINNTQSEIFALDGQRLVLAAPVNLALLRESEVYYRWVLCHYPTSSALAQALNGINAGVKLIRDKILTEGDLNPYQTYFNIPAQKREVSLILAGYDMNPEGKILVTTPLPETEEYRDLIDVTLRLLRGYRPLLGHAVSSEDLNSFAEQLHEDLVRLFTGDMIFRVITPKARQRVLTIASVSSGGHQGLFRCHSLARAAVGEEFPIRKLIRDLPDGYGMSWIPTAAIRLHIIDSRSTNHKSAELNAFAYSKVGTRLPSVQIIDVNPEDSSKDPSIELHDAPSQYSRSGEASIAWHIELIPSGLEQQNLSVLPRPHLRTLDQETRFIEELVHSINNLDADPSTPRYTFGHRAIHAEELPDVTNTGDKYQLPISADKFKAYNLELVGQMVNSLKRNGVDDETIERLKSPGGYTLVVAAFLENPGVNGVLFEAEEADAAEGHLISVYSNALLFRMLEHHAARIGIPRATFLRSRGIRDFYENILHSCAKDFELAEKRYSGNEKPLLGVFVIQYDLDQDTYENSLRNAAIYRERKRIESELRERGSRARELIEANIVQYEQLIKALLANRRTAAEYADWVFKRHVTHLPEIEQRDPFGIERALREVLSGARDYPRLLLSDYGVRPVRYGASSNPRNQSGYDAMWYHDQGTDLIAPMACGEGIAMFPPTSDEGTTLTAEAIEWIVRCWREHTKLLVKPTSTERFGPVELHKRPDDRTSDDVVKFLSDSSNDKAFASIVFVTNERTSTAAQRMAYEDFHTVITTLTDINGIRHVIDPANEPLTRFIEALRRVPVEDDDFSSKRYRRLLVSVLTTKLARLATILNLVQFQTSEAIGYSGPSVVDSDPQPEITPDERAARLVRKQLLSFDPQRYVTQASVPTLSAAIRRLLATEGYSSKLSDADKMFLEEFFRVPEPPKNLTQLDDTPVIVRLPNQADEQEQPVASGHDRVIVDLGRNEQFRNPPRFFDEDSEQEPSPGPRRRVPGLDEDQSESEAPSTPGSSTGPSPGSSRTPFDTSLVDDIIARFNSLEIALNKRVGASRYLRPMDEYEEARANPFRHQGAPNADDDSITILTGPNRYGLTKGGLDKIVSEVMRETRKTLNNVIDTLYEVLQTNRQVLNGLDQLVYTSSEDKLIVEGLYGHLIQMYDRSLIEVQEIIRDGFNTTTVFERSSFPTNRVQNEIRKEALKSLRGNVAINESLVRTTAAEIARGVYAKIGDELLKVDTRLILPSEREKSLMRSFHFYVDVEAALKTLIKALVVLPQYWDTAEHTKNLTDTDKRGARAKLDFYKNVISTVTKLTGIDDEVAALDTLLRSTPRLSISASTQLRTALETLRGENNRFKPEVIRLREELENALLHARQLIFEELYKQVGPDSIPDQTGKQGLTVLKLIRRLREEIYRMFILEDRRKAFEVVTKHLAQLSGQVSAARKTVDAWKERVKAGVAEGAGTKAPPPPATPTTSREAAELKRKLETFVREHEEFVFNMSLRGKSSEVAQHKLKDLYTAADNALSHPQAGDTYASLTNVFNKFCFDYMDAFWTDRSITFILAEKAIASQVFESEFMKTREGMTKELPGTYYLGTSLRLFEEGKEQTIRMLAEEFVRGIRRALDIPTWTIRPAIPDLAPVIADADRRERAAKLDDLTTRSFQELLHLLRELSNIRPRAAENSIRANIHQILGIVQGFPTPPFAEISDRMKDLAQFYATRSDKVGIWVQVMALWTRVLDLVKDASRRCHEHLLPWLKDVQNIRFSVQQNPRLSGVCALESFCYISDKGLIKNVFELARQFLALDRERTEAVLTKGLASALQSETKLSATEEESSAFLSLLKEISGDIDSGRLPLSELVARMRPADLVSSEATIHASLLSVLTDATLRPSGRLREKAPTINDWQNELNVLCFSTRKIIVDALLAARTEISAQRLISVYSQLSAGKVSATVNSVINALASMERALLAPGTTAAYLSYFLDPSPEALPPAAVDIEIKTAGLDEAFKLYLKSIKAFMQKTGLKRIGDSVTSVAPHLSKASSAVKTTFTRNLVQIFGPSALRLYIGAAQDAIERPADSGVDYQSADLSEEFVRRALELLNVLPNSLHSALLTGEDLLRFFAKDNMDEVDYAKFVDENLICGSNRFLYIEPSNSSWTVATRASSNVTKWNRIYSNGQTGSLIKPSSTESFTTSPGDANVELSLEDFIDDLTTRASGTSKANIKRPHPSILINGSLLLDMMRKLDEMRTTNSSGTDANQRVLVRQLGFVQPLPPMIESRPSDQQPELVPESVEELMDSGVVVEAARPAVPKTFALPSVAAAPKVSDAAKVAADVVLLLNRVSEGRDEVQRAVDAWTELYQRFASQLNASIKVTTESSLEEPRRSQIQTSVSQLLNGFNEKSAQVRNALFDRLKDTNKFNNLLVKIQSGRTEDVLLSPVLRDVITVEQKELRDLRDSISASSMRFQEIEKNMQSWIAKAASAINAKFSTSSALQAALKRGRQLDQAVLSGVQSAGTSS